MKKILLAVCAALLLALGGACLCLRHEDAAVRETLSQQDMKKIVIDAGHGEPDGGAVGTAEQVRESLLNLQIADKLKLLAEDAGYTVVMTRDTEQQIGGSKNADMAERRRIIEESGQRMTVSIHQNFYEGDSSVSGPQVFYAPGSREGMALAAAIQRRLNEEVNPDSPRTEHEGNYYIVKSGSAPAVIVECGFLSNAGEENLLQKSQYQLRLAKAILAGVEDYLKISASAED